MEGDPAKMDMISLEPSNSSKPLDLNDFIPMESPVPSSSHAQAEDKIKAFDEFVEEPLHTEESPSYWSIEFFKPYFEVKTSTVVDRLRKVVLPAGDFFGQERPDMYGPFWIVTTLVCAVTIVANEVDDQEGYKVSLLVWSAGVLYGLAVGVPIVAYCVLRSESNHITFARLMSLYCYSYLLFIPSTLLSAFVAWGWSLILVCISVLWSLFFIIKHGLVTTTELERTQKGLLIAAVLGGHVGLGFFLNWYLVAKKI
jgi:hypothetical protein